MISNDEVAFLMDGNVVEGVEIVAVGKPLLRDKFYTVYDFVIKVQDEYWSGTFEQWPFFEFKVRPVFHRVIKRGNNDD